MEKTYFNWSSGKDAALALYYLQKEGKHEVNKLLTSVNAHYGRVSMHGLRRELLEKQAEAIGLPLNLLELPAEPSMEEYNQLMEKAILGLKSEGYTHTAFGDIFLEDLRKYREEQLKAVDVQAIFPLWKKDTKALIHEFLALGFKAIVVCINGELLDKSFVGREINENFLEDLPHNVDPCGENGEFHTFCFDGPIFNNPIQFSIGEKVFRAYKKPKDEESDEGEEKMGFWFCDLLP